jgi:predicted nucleic acid-binding protein
MKAVIDTCIVIDALQNREPFNKEAQKIFLLCADQYFDGFLTANSVTDIYYLTHKQTHSDKATREILTKLFIIFFLLDTTATDVRAALSSGVSDFEDAVMIESAARSGMDCIVTRNVKDYSGSPIPVYTPAAFIELISESSELEY